MKIIKIFLVSCVVIFLSYYFYMEEYGNFHMVKRRVFYRSGQLDKDELLLYIKKYGIKSILNLRGKKPEAEWYKEEIKISNSLKIKHFDFGISPTHKVTIGKIRDIMNIIKKAPKPILVHCKAGADRTGLISAIWVYANTHDAKEAYRQLSIKYLHLPYIGKTDAMDKSFWNYVNSKK